MDWQLLLDDIEAAKCSWNQKRAILMSREDIKECFAAVNPSSDQALSLEIMGIPVFAFEGLPDGRPLVLVQALDGILAQKV